MDIKTKTGIQEKSQPVPVLSGFAKLDGSGSIITGDDVFYGLLKMCPRVDEKENLLQFLNSDADCIETIPAKHDHRGAFLRKIFRMTINSGRIWEKKIVDFRVESAVTEDEKGYTVMISEITDIWKKERLLDLLVKISNAMLLSVDLSGLIRDIRFGLSSIMDTTNFYVALYDEKNDLLNFPLFDDAQDDFDTVSARGTLSAYVIETGKAMLLREDDFAKLRADGKVELVGSDSSVWMGAPLQADGKTFGVISLQSYEDPDAYNNTDLEILALVASQVGLAIDRTRKEEDITAGKTYFEQLFHYAPVAIVIQKYPGVISDVNNAFEQLFGYTAAEVIGKSIDEVVASDEDIDDATELTRRAFEGEKIEREVLRKKKDGQLIDVALNARVFQINPGEKVVYAIYQNISEKKVYERQLVEAKEKAEEADRLKSAFLTNMSHEIRTPMNAILGFSQLLASEDTPSENKKEFTRIILESGESLLHLIDDILDLAKIESGQMTLRKESVDIKELMTSLHVTFLEINEKKLHKDIEIKLTLPHTRDPLVVVTDPLRLRQILTNLIGNAIKFTLEGKIEFGYAIVKDNSGIEFYVRDTGIGIASEKLKVIFDRFQQVDNSRTRQYSGTGLGLAISRKLADLLGGEISVDSIEGEGSTFKFLLPYQHLEELIGDTNLKELMVEYPNLTQFRILLAEDDEINFLFMREILKKTGVQLIRASTGVEVLEYIRKNKDVDLVLMDIEMPEMNGYEATRQIKSEFPEISVLAQTAYATAEEKNKCLEAGCDDYISKPIQIQKLFSMIREQLKIDD